jgi:signal transduction histidine kinase/ligand-binding sensor domain-containing protein
MKHTACGAARPPPRPTLRLPWAPGALRWCLQVRLARGGGRRAALHGAWLFVATLLCAAAHAAAGIVPLAAMEHRAWTAKDGAPTDARAMAQTRDGYLWMNGSPGLIRFDGLAFVPFVADEGALPDLAAYTMMAAPQGGLWVGWQLGGVSFIHEGKVRNYTVADGISPGTVFGFAVDRSGAVWMASIAGVARFDGRRWEKMGPAQGFDARFASAVFVDRDGTLAVFTDRGMFTRAAGAARFAPPIGAITPRQPPQQGRDGRIYFLEERGIRVIDTLARHAQLDHPWILRDTTQRSGSMLVDSTGALWFNFERALRRAAPGAALAAGAVGAAPGSERFTARQGLSDDEVNFMLEDRAGNIWVSTRLGLDRFRRVDIQPVPPGTRSYNREGALLLAAPDQGMWLGFSRADYPLLRVDGAGSLRDTVRAGEVHASLLLADGSVWLATNQGLLHYTGGKQVERIAMPAALAAAGFPFAFARDAAGDFWVSITNVGVFRVRRGVWQQVASLPDGGKKAALSVLADQLGRLWFGYSDNRVAMLAGERLTMYGAAGGLDIGPVAALRELDGRVYAAGGKGLAYLDGGRAVALRSATEGAFKGISDLCVDGAGDLWLNAGAGLVRVTRAEWQRALAAPGYRMQHRMFNALDGLAGTANVLDRQSIALAGDGRLWLSTNLGTYTVAPGALLPLALPAEPVVLSLRSDGVRYLRGGPVRVAAGSGDLEIDYAAVDLSLPERLRYRYRLAGHDRQWQDAGARRQAFYTGVVPGNYHFQVQVMNGAGVWSAAREGMRFTLLPAYHQTAWFKTLCGALVLLALWLLHRLRLRQVAARLKAQMAERMAERERIARELHDTLFQGTQAMIMQVHSASAALAVDDPVRALLNGALDRADDLLVEGREQVHDLRAQDYLGADFGAAIERAWARHAGPAAPAFALRVAGRTRALAPGVAHELFRIVNEALGNAARHAHSAHVTVELDYGWRTLRLRLADDGCGLPAAVLRDGGLPGHWGLQGMRERAKRIGGTLTIGAAPAGGTLLALCVPARLAYLRRPVTTSN